MYNTDFHALKNPTEESEQFIEAVSLFFDCVGRLAVEPPLYKLYPNKLYRDFNKAVRVRQYLNIIIHTILAIEDLS